MRRALHDARLWVSEVVLVAIARSWHRWCRRATTPGTPPPVLPFLALRQLGLIPRLLGYHTLCGASLQHPFGLPPTRQPVLPPAEFLAHHQPLGYLPRFAL